MGSGKMKDALCAVMRYSVQEALVKEINSLTFAVRDNVGYGWGWPWIHFGRQPLMVSNSES